MNNILLRRLDLKLSLLFALTSVMVVLTLQLGAAAISLWQSPSNEKIALNLVAELNERKADMISAFLNYELDSDELDSDEQAASFLRLSESIYASEMKLNAEFEEDFSYDSYISTLQTLAFYDSEGRLLEEFLCPHCNVVNSEENLTLDSEPERGIFKNSEREPLSAVIAAQAILSSSNNSLIVDDRDQTVWLHYRVQESKDSSIIGHVFVQVFIPSIESFMLPMLVDTYIRDLPEILFFSLIIGALIGSIISRGVIKRILHISHITRSWAQGNLNSRINDKKQDELNGMANDMNTMAKDLAHWLSDRESMVMQEERTRVARDLHDTVKQKMFALQMQLSSAKQVTQQDPAMTFIVQALQLVRDSQEDLKSIIYALRPISLEQKGLIQSIRDYLLQWQLRTGIIVQVYLDEPQEMSNNLEDTLYNIFQELMANIERHAQAKNVTVNLSIITSEIVLTIEDDGIGFDEESTEKEGVNASTGLQNIRERLDEQNGRLTVTNNPDQGARMQVIVHPIPPIQPMTGD